MRNREKRCCEPNCQRVATTRGMCERHYQKDYYRRNNSYRVGGHEGIVRVPGVRGWGYVDE